MTVIKHKQIDTAYNIYLSLYQGLADNNHDDAYKQFSAEFFDLIIVDECHRGSAREDSKWREILEYFKGATHVGLTATPKETEEVSSTEYFGEPASLLLESIRAEKVRLVAAKKIRVEKALPKINAAEIPFEIPKDWEWCHFGDLIRAYEAGSSFKCDDREITGKEWGVIKTSAVTSGNFVESENKFLAAKAPNDTTAQVKIGDLIFCRASGSKGLAGVCATVRDCSQNLLLSDKTIRVRLMDGVIQEYIALHNASTQSKTYFRGLSTGKSTSMNNVTRGELFRKPVPLPPLLEQAAIVQRVQTLMVTFRTLEAEIKRSRAHASHLLQAVLKAAFAPPRKTPRPLVTTFEADHALERVG